MPQCLCHNVKVALTQIDFSLKYQLFKSKRLCYSNRLFKLKLILFEPLENIAMSLHKRKMFLLR